MIDSTHDVHLRSWVESANVPGCDFPIQNLPLGVFATASNPQSRIGVAIGDSILDLSACMAAGLLNELDDPIRNACSQAELNTLMSLGRTASGQLRRALSRFLANTSLPQIDFLVLQSEAQMGLPARIGNYTDFYASIHHATNVGGLFRPDNPLLPNYKYVPIGYHGRASSVVSSGTEIRRPLGQTRNDPDRPPNFGACQFLDYELEVGFFIGSGNDLGSPIPISEASDHLFGACLVNDWSARDIQSWEYQPLGPFLSKSFATSASPWIITMEALAPFRTAAMKRLEGDLAPLPYLWNEHDQAGGALNLMLEMYLSTADMRSTQLNPARLSRSNFAQMYWTPAQLCTHHSSNGCNLRPGDLIASGTVSGPTEQERGCLLELTSRGIRSLTLPSGEKRTFLQDGDECIIRGYCEREGYNRIGFGECRGRIVPAQRSE